MIKVYCDICDREITEDCEDEGIDWKELTLRNSINNSVIWTVEHICKKCEPYLEELHKLLLKHGKTVG